jgi:hypothetical protein
VNDETQLPSYALWFSLTKLGDPDVCLLWRDGRLYCDHPLLIQLCNMMAEISKFPPIWAPYPEKPSEPLSDYYWAWEIMSMHMGTQAVQRGTLPPIADPPDGAVV